ncbi:MAG: polysaccharide biosynthesis tyrosine autokinase, partial [Chloroflexota bacterium]
DLQVKIQDTQDDITDKQDELTNMVSARQIADAQNQIAAFQTKLNTLQSNYASLLSNTQQGALNTLTVIEPASVPSKPVGPDIPMTVLSSLAIGFVLAAAAAYLLEYLDNSIKGPEDVKKLSNLPTLAGIAHISGERYRDKLITVKHPRSPISEAYRSLRTNIQFSTIDHPNRAVLLVTSPSPTEGKSVTIANLGVVLAQAGHKTLIIDADLRRPVQHRIFQLSNKHGITDFLLEVNEEEIQDQMQSLLSWCVQKTDVDGLHVITSGALPPNPSELLGSEKMKKTLSSLSRIYNYILLDSPPGLVVTDAAVLSAQADGVILVLNADSTTKNQLQQIVGQFDGINKKSGLLGVVLNDLTHKRDGYYYNYYYYKKSYYYREETAAYDMEGGNGSARVLNNKIMKGLSSIFNGSRSRNKPQKISSSGKIDDESQEID